MHINAANINATGVATDIAKVPQWGSTGWKLESCSISWRRRAVPQMRSSCNAMKLVGGKGRLDHPLDDYWGSWIWQSSGSNNDQTNPGWSHTNEDGASLGRVCWLQQLIAADTITPPMAASPEVCICHIASNPRLTASKLIIVDPLKKFWHLWAAPNIIGQVAGATCSTRWWKPEKLVTPFWRPYEALWSMWIRWIKSK